MLQPIKLKHPETDVFFVSDLHWGQECSGWQNPLWKMRGYETKEAYSSGIIERWNAKANNETSICFHLGDFIFNDAKGDKFIELTKRLNFKTLFLLWGNHNSSSKYIYKKTLIAKFPDAVTDNKFNYEVYPLIYEVGLGKRVVFLPEYAEAIINKDLLVLCHYPVISHNHQADGSYHFSAHSHGNCALTNKDTGVGRRLDVGVESFGEPISLKQAKDHLKYRLIDSVDHHGKV